MKVLKTLLVVLIAGGLLVTVFGCGSKTSDTTASTQVATVKKGDLSLDITAAGNLALSKTEDLAIDLFYPTGTKGTIGNVLVGEGDSIKEGQVLVTLDTDEWNNQLSNLQNLVTTAERTLTQMQASLLSAQQTLASLQDTSSKQKTILSAEVSLQQAQATLAAGVSAVDFDAVNAALNKAKTWYEYVNTYLKLSMNPVDWELALENAKLILDTAQANYDNMLAGYDSRDLALKKKQVAIARMTLDAAQKDLANVPQAVALQQMQITLAEGKVTDAQKALDDARKNLTDAQGKSPEIKAPFDGFVTTVNVKGGDEVLKGTVAVTVADPTRFEADIYVSEMDIMKVSLGGDATITLNAMPGVSLPAKVTHIAPTAVPSSTGVVNYIVKVEVDSEAASMLQTGSIPATSANTTRQQGGPPAGFTPRAGFTPPAGTESATPSVNQATSQTPSAVTQNFQLKQGLTGTVDLIVAQRNNVLLVPNNAITKTGNQSSVQVVTGNTTTEKRIVQTGLSDWQNTEITSGLSEGEKVIVPKNTTTTTTSTSQQRPQGIPFLGR